VSYKTQVPIVRITVQRVTFDDPAETAAATESWNSSAAVMLRLLGQYEKQLQETPAGCVQIGSHIFRVAQNA
jgi:hypothetical protein